MSTPAICTIDLGTSTIKAGLVGVDGALLGLESQPAPVEPGSVSYDGDRQLAVATQVVASMMERSPVRPPDVAAIIITGQRAGLVAVGPQGQPLGPAWSWQDPSGEQAARDLDAALQGRFRAITGLPPNAMWTSSKIPLQRARGLSDTRYLLLHDHVLHGLGARGYHTDPSLASSTGLLDTASLQWSPAILEALDIHEGQLPLLVPAGSRAGHLCPDAARVTGLPAGLPLLVGAGDQQCAALAAGALHPGDAALCLGTAAILSCPVSRPLTGPDAGGGVCTVHAVPGRWVLEAVQSCYGSAWAWWQRCCPEPHSPTASPAGGAIFVPSLAGISSPDFDPHARGAFLGLALNHSNTDLRRAVSEGLALELRRVLESITSAADLRPPIRVVGGGSTDDAQRLATLLGRRLWMSQVAEASLVGAAIIGWSALGAYIGLEKASSTMALAVGNSVAPQPQRARQYDTQYQRYLRAVELVRAFSSSDILT